MRLREWASHVWRKICSIVRATIEDNLTGKRPLESPGLRWEDWLKADVGKILPWRVAAEEIDGWKGICFAVWSQ